MRELYHKFFATNKSREEYFWFEGNHHQSVDKVTELRNNMPHAIRLSHNPS